VGVVVVGVGGGGATMQGTKVQGVANWAAQ